mmetsp:Transcript_72483/g.212438  ORF Transcript_72483/g.212438 Transcript_72483/m.212438 type:complete len:222 (-) Transcript_72483:198-863(-)
MVKNMDFIGGIQLPPRVGAYLNECRVYFVMRVGLPERPDDLRDRLRERSAAPQEPVPPEAAAAPRAVSGAGAEAVQREDAASRIGRGVAGAGRGPGAAEALAHGAGAVRKHLNFVVVVLCVVQLRSWGGWLPCKVDARPLSEILKHVLVDEFRIRARDGVRSLAVLVLGWEGCLQSDLQSAYLWPRWAHNLENEAHNRGGKKQPQPMSADRLAAMRKIVSS